MMFLAGLLNGGGINRKGEFILNDIVTKVEEACNRRNISLCR